MGKDKLMRIDEELANQIKKFADKNKLSLRQASRELARLNTAKFTNKKLIREIRF